MKDPNKPKRGMSGYFFFMNEIRSELREENPDAKVTGKFLFVPGQC